MKHESLLQDPKTWVALSFVLFMIGFYRYAVPAIMRMLDARSAKIRDELEQATSLRQEAEAVLASYKAKEKDMLREAEAMLAHARSEAEALKMRAEAEMKEATDRRIAQANDNIARAEQAAMQTIRENIVDIALATARKTMIEKLENADHDPAIAQALKDIERIIH